MPQRFNCLPEPAAAGTDPTTTSQQIVELLHKLCTAIRGKEDEKTHSEMVLHAVQFIAQSPHAINSTMLLNEPDCVRKIVSELNTNTFKQFPEPGDLFLVLYVKLDKLHIEPSLRHKLLNFFLHVMNTAETSSSPISSCGKSENPICASAKAAYVSAREDRRSEALVQSHLLQLAQKSNCSKSSIFSNNNRTTLSNSTSKHNCNVMHSYDSLQGRVGLGRVPVPNYLDILKQKSTFKSVHDKEQNVIYAFAGVQSNCLKKDIYTGRFKLDKLHMQTQNRLHMGLSLRLAELGYYYDRVSKFANVSTGFNAIGCMGQALITGLKGELTKFHGDVALLQDRMDAYRNAQGQGQENRMDGLSDRLSLMKMLHWFLPPLTHMQWLTKIADAAQMRKGGELTSVVYDLLQSGDPIANKLTQSMLTSICGPMARMISKWMLEGGLDDSYGEFFVESLTEVGADRLWYDKFRLRVNMLPKFIPLELAIKILKTGKSINFLREICESQDMVLGRDKLKKIIEENVSEIFSFTHDTQWHAAIETCYQQTSKHVLDIMVGPHKLLDHLHGMRRYLLLGQGDFVTILIENMKDALDKDGAKVYSHDLSVMLDSALRCTNAQYDDPEILNHLDVNVQTAYPGDTGWDIVSLQYTVTGPLATMLEPSMSTYKSLFKPLWRMKHMEYVLSMKIWKVQMSNSKALRGLKADITKASYSLHLFTAEIIHFVHQMQYYVLFEVIECNWVELQKRMLQATALDEILEAHEKFLQAITCGCFISSSTNIERYLEVVYDNIISLENWQLNFYDKCFKELNSRQDYQKRVRESEKTGSFGVTAEQKLERDNARKIFEQNVAASCRSLENIALTYEKAVRGFLLALNSSADPNLQLFGTRLDFNEYYKKRDTSLSVPLTFEHMRMSNVFNGHSKHLIGSRYSMQNLANTSPAIPTAKD